MLHARRQSSDELYQCYWKRWIEFCDKRNIDPLGGTVLTGTEFLQNLLNEPGVHRGYSTLNTARAALSAIIILPGQHKFGDHPYVKLFMRGVFNLKPSIPRYNEIWDTDVVLEMLKKWAPARKISLKKLTLKVVTLLLLVTGQRGQIIRSLSTEAMSIDREKIVFTVDCSQVKQGRPGYRPENLTLKVYPKDKNLCIHRYLSVYLLRTLELRGNVKEVFISFKKPHKKVSRDTVSRWVKTVLEHSGIDSNKFKPGSTRAASVSKAKECGATLDEILKAGGWSRESTFAKWYNKTITTENKTLGEVILQ